MCLGEVALWFFELLILVSLLGRLEDLIRKPLQSLGVEDVDLVQEPFKLSQRGPILLVMT
jgi:hypothetical protein